MLCNICLLERKKMHWACGTCRSGALCSLCFLKYHLRGGTPHKCCPVCKTGPCRDYLLWKIFFPDASRSIFTRSGDALQENWFRDGLADLRKAYVRKNFCTMIFALANMLRTSFPHAPHDESIMFLQRCAAPNMQINEQLFDNALMILLPHVDLARVSETTVANLLRALYDNSYLHSVLRTHGRTFLTRPVIVRLCAMHFTRIQWLIPCLTALGKIDNSLATLALRSVLQHNIFTVRARRLFEFFGKQLDSSTHTLDLSGVALGERAVRLLAWTFTQKWNPIQELRINWSSLKDPMLPTFIMRSVAQGKWWTLSSCDILEITNHMRRSVPKLCRLKTRRGVPRLGRLKPLVRGFNKAVVPREMSCPPRKKRKIRDERADVICIDCC